MTLKIVTNKLICGMEFGRYLPEFSDQNRNCRAPKNKGNSFMKGPLVNMNINFIQNLINQNQLLQFTYIYTYTIGHYNTSVRITTQLLTALMLWALIFTHQRRDLEFKANSERQIFLGKTFHGNFIFFKVFSKNLQSGSRRRNIVFICSFNIRPGV